MRDVINGLTRQIAALLKDPLQAQGVHVTARFPAREQPVPLRQMLVAVGLQEAAFSSQALADYWGTQAGGAVFGRMLEVTALLTICAVPGGAAADLQQVFGLLCDVLLFEQQELDITRVWCGAASFQPELHTLALPCFAKLRMPVCGGLPQPMELPDVVQVFRGGEPTA